MSRKSAETPRTAFLSLGSCYEKKYESFADALVETLAVRGIALKSVGYNVGTHQQPMLKVIEVLDQSHGAVIVAFNRIEVADGTEKGVALTSPTRITTPWNHIEAAMAYDRGLPLLVIVEEGVKQEGLLEKSFDWYVLEMPLKPSALREKQFILNLEEWITAVEARRSRGSTVDVDEMTFVDLIKGLKVTHVAAVAAALAASYVAVFQLGLSVGGGSKWCCGPVALSRHPLAQCVALSACDGIYDRNSAGASQRCRKSFGPSHARRRCWVLR